MLENSYQVTKRRIPIKPSSRQATGDDDDDANRDPGLNDPHMNAFLMSVQGNNDGCKASIDHEAVSEKDYARDAEGCDYARKIEADDRR